MKCLSSSPSKVKDGLDPLGVSGGPGCTDNKLQCWFVRDGVLKQKKKISPVCKDELLYKLTTSQEKMVTLTCLGDTWGRVGNKRTSITTWWGCRALALGMFSWKMEPSWNCVNGQNTEELQRMVFCDQACLIFVKNRVVKVSTSHHPRYAVCISPLPCFGRSASLVLLHLLWLTPALFHPSSEEQESCCILPHMCREALGSGHPVLPWDV